MNRTSYSSFRELYSSILRGNEIEFQYMGKHYYVLPHFDGNNVVGVDFGAAYSENEDIYFSEYDLYHACIENTIFGKIFPQIDITWRNF